MLFLKEQDWNCPPCKHRLNLFEKKNMEKLCERLLHLGICKFCLFFFLSFFSGRNRGEPTVERSGTFGPAGTFTNKLKKKKTGPTCAIKKGMRRINT